MRDRSGALPTKPTTPQQPTHHPRATEPLPPQATPARWPNETARHGNITTTQTPHTPWPYGIACHTCHHTSVHATQADATTAARAHTCTAPLPPQAAAALTRLQQALRPEATR